MTESTGSTRVDEALGQLAEAAVLPPAEQVAAFEAAHRALQETLASVDEA
ncbi:hypothetical protein [Longispora albida]|nr:hypothetical protein [Longispora albida]